MELNLMKGQIVAHYFKNVEKKQKNERKKD